MENNNPGGIPLCAVFGGIPLNFLLLAKRPLNSISEVKGVKEKHAGQRNTR